jgi:hypothetical protein
VPVARRLPAARLIAYHGYVMWRALTCVLLLYVTLDFADPNIPGALDFEIDQSVDGVHTQLRGQSPIAKASVVPAPVFQQDMAPLKAHVVPQRPRVIARTMPVDVRPRALLSRLLISDSPEAH